MLARPILPPRTTLYLGNTAIVGSVSTTVVSWLGVNNNCWLGVNNNCWLGVNNNCWLGANNNCRLGVNNNCRLGVNNNCQLGANNNCRLGVNNNCRLSVNNNCRLGVNNNCWLSVKVLESVFCLACMLHFFLIRIPFSKHCRFLPKLKVIRSACRTDDFQFEKDLFIQIYLNGVLLCIQVRAI